MYKAGGYIKDFHSQESDFNKGKNVSNASVHRAKMRAHTDCNKQRQVLQFTRVLICSFPRFGSVCVRLGLMGTLVVGVLSKLLKYQTAPLVQRTRHRYVCYLVISVFMINYCLIYQIMFDKGNGEFRWKNK